MTQTHQEIRVCIDIGSEKHYVAIGLSTGKHIEEFPLSHTTTDIDRFMKRLEELEAIYALPITVAMEGYNGYARPIDSYILAKGYRLFNVNNHKLARFREIFPGPAKTDPLDAWKIFELFKVKDALPAAKNALQEVKKNPEINEKLKHYTRRRRDLVEEKTRITNRLQGDLQAASPGLLNITKDVSNLWFLRFLASRDNISLLPRLKENSLLQIKGIGKSYRKKIQEWQEQAKMAEKVDWMGEMIAQDAKKVLKLLDELKKMDKAIEEMVEKSELGKRIKSIPGFGAICAGELAGEIGNRQRYKGESSLALYLGMAVLDKKSGKHNGVKCPKNVNRRAKLAMMTGTARHINLCPEAKRYYDKKRLEGKKHNQGVRSLGRHLVRVIWSMLKHDRDYILKEEKNNEFTELSKNESPATISVC